MVLDPNCPCSPEEVDLAFRNSEPYVEQEIADRSYNQPRFYADMAPVKVFPDGVGYELSKVRFYGDIGPQNDGYDGWTEVRRSTPGGNHENAHDACGYNWEVVGHGFEELHYKLMKRELRTVPICVQDIRTFFQFEQHQDLIFKNLANITLNQKEQVNRNSVIGFSVKHVPTANGLEVNAANPYELPNVSNVVVGKLTFQTLKELYTPLLHEAAPYSLTTINNRPVFGLIASDETLDDMFLEDPDIRQDIRNLASGGDSAGKALLERYNFMEGVRNMFINIPDIHAPRYKDDGNGNLIRVFPYDRDVQIQAGTRPVTNPEYHNAEYELVIVMTRDPFCLRARKSITSVGGQTDFEATTSMFEWKWHNPERWCDPKRRIGFYYAIGEVGIEPGDFTDYPSILIRRRPRGLSTKYWGVVTDPGAQGAVSNVLEAQGCPCPQVIDVIEDVTDNTVLQFKFSSDVSDFLDTGNLSIKLRNGGIVTGAATLTGDGLAGSIDFGEAVAADPNLYTEVYCDVSLACEGKAITDSTNASNAAHRDVRLDTLLRAEVIATATISALYGDGTYGSVTVEAVNKDTLVYTVSGADATQCIVGLCVPTALVAGCPGCVADNSIACNPAAALP